MQRHFIELPHIRTCFTFSLISGRGLTVLLRFLALAISVLFRMEGLTGILRAHIFAFPIGRVGVLAESLL